MNDMKNNKENQCVCDYDFFHEVIEYGNENWKCYLTDTEIADATMEFLEYFRESVSTGNVIHEISEFLGRLDEDDCEESLHYANVIRNGLGMLTVLK